MGKFCAIDIGNTDIKIATVVGDKIKNIRLQSSDIKTIPIPHNIKTAIVCSVKNHKYTFKSGSKILFAEKDIEIPMKTKYERKNLGVDRLLASYAGYEITKKSTIIINLGTALTVDFVAKNSLHQGGIITAGYNLMLESLSKKCDKLPLVNAKQNHRYLQLTTEQAIQSGTYILISSFIEKLKKLHKNYVLIGSGGSSSLFKRYFDIHKENIVILGLIKLYHYHFK
ncbi:MAG: type III pantothenate kinase [Planctomycetes bacterium]|nr:type III pantothenate kinase [Planctomycetota bacterium]